MGMNVVHLPSLEYAPIKKLVSWLYRYAPSEVAGTVSALSAAGLAAYWGGNSVVIAVAGAWGEMLGFYTPMVIREFTGSRRNRAMFPALWYTIRNLLLEFGAAELLDTGLLRPGLMALAMQLIVPTPLAIVIGKFAADIFFYGLAICGYELRQRIDAHCAPALVEIEPPEREHNVHC